MFEVKRPLASVASLLVLAAPALAAPVLAAPAPASASVRDTVPSVASTAEARRAPAAGCRGRVLNPTKPVPAARFGTCVAKAMKAGRSVKVATTTDGVVAKAVIRYGATTDFSSSSAGGSVGLVSIGKDAWYRDPQTPWIKAKRNGTQAEHFAFGVASLARASNSTTAYRAVLASSTTDWQPTGVRRKINGLRVREYVGTPVFEGVGVVRYAVWLADNDLPARVVSTLSVGGLTSGSVQNFTGWGKPVVIKPPKVR